MDDDLLSIGTFARASGLSVSALRFYDKADVLVPAVVEAATGYRRYHPSQLDAARLVAGMRRISMPLAEIGVVLEQRSDRETAEQILDDHLRRLEDGLTDARREVARLRAQLLRLSAEQTPAALRAHVSATELMRALDTVRHAVGADPDFPVLAGILVELDVDVCRLVATDRYRLVLAEVPILRGQSVIGQARRPVAEADQAPAAVVVPATFAQEIRQLLTRDADGATEQPEKAVVGVRVSDGEVEVRVGAHSLATSALEGDYPDYRRLLHTVDDPRPETVALDRLRSELTGPAAGEGPTADDDVVLLGRRDGVIGLRPAATDGPVVAVNREFLLQAAEAIPGAQLQLDLDGPIAPLVIRSGSDEHALSLLMPVRIEA